MVPGDIKLVHPQLRDIHDDRGLSEENLRLNAFMRSVVDNCQSGVVIQEPLLRRPKVENLLCSPRIWEG